MAFLEIDPKKLASLLEQGTHEGELKKFFSDCQKFLIFKGARVQNLPYGRAERIRAICERLPSRADEVVQTWFQKNISIADALPLDDVLIYLEAFFNEDEPLPESEEKSICRSALNYLFAEDPSIELLSLLRRPQRQLIHEQPSSSNYPTEHISESEDSTISADSSKVRISQDEPQERAIADLIASIISGDENSIDNSLAAFSEGIRGLVEGLLRLRDGDADGAREQLARLPPRGPEFEIVQSALARASHLRNTSALPAGIRTHLPQPLKEDPSSDEIEIIGLYTSEISTGSVFVDPLFVLIDGELLRLSMDDRFRIFPESGSVMTRKALKQPFRRGEMVRWSVSERDGAEGRTRFHMNAELSSLIQVVHIAVPSSDADEVRSRIRSYLSTGPLRSGTQAIFLLSDNIAVAPPRGVDLARENAFEQPWQAWSSLETWLIEGRQYCLDKPQGATSNLDLSPLETAFKRLLNNLESEQKLTLSKAQRREVSALLRHQPGGEIAHRAKRIASSIDQISINSEELDVVLKLLGSHDEVRQRVDELIAKGVEVRQKEKSGLQSEIAALRKTKSELEREGREIEKRNHTQMAAIAESVRGAFDQAIEDGAAALATAEIFNILSSTAKEHCRQEPLTATDNLDAGSVIHGALSSAEVKARLSALGINGRKALVLSELAKLAEKCGIPLVIKGAMSRQCVLTLMREERNSIAIFDVPMGLTSSSGFRKRLQSLGEVEGLAILNADVSPLEIYAAGLIDVLMEDGITNSMISPIFLSCLGGDFSLPLPLSLRMVSLLVDLDSNWDKSDYALDSVDGDDTVLLPIFRERIETEVTSVEASIRQEVERALVNSLLSK